MNGNKIVLRKAELNDSKQIFCWRNDPLTRKNSLDNNIVSLSVHNTWFNRVVNSPEHLILIGSINDHKIGMIRYDKLSENVHEISINLAPDSRGHGLGVILLKEALFWVKGTIIAMIKKNNIPSIISFQMAGYTLFKEENDLVEMRTEGLKL